MKKHLLILAALVLVLVSCRNEDDFYNDFNDDPTTWVEDDSQTDDPDNEGGAEGGEGSLTLYQVTENEISKIKDFQVAQNLQPFQQDYAKHIKMWDFVTRLLPLEERDKIEQFEVFHGGGDLLGYVEPIDYKDLSKWKFALAIDAAEELDVINFKDLFTYVTIHEYGHVLTLNDEQLNVGENEGSCNNYFPGEGCSYDDSYINRLYELGWKDIIAEHDPDNPATIYEKYKDRFVSDYAATNPGEDIAEVFSFFVTQENRPSGNSIADQKIKLMYEFPELVELRQRIRSNGTTLGLRAGSWTTNPAMQKFRVCNRKGCKRRHG